MKWTYFLYIIFGMKWNALIFLMIAIFSKLDILSTCFPLRTYSKIAIHCIGFSHSQEEDHPFIYYTLVNKNTQLGCLYIFTELIKTNVERLQSIMIKNLCICANITRCIHFLSMLYDISCFVFILKKTSRYVGWFCSYIYGLLWWLLGCCATFQNNEGEWLYFVSFARFPMHHCEPNEFCYRNTYWWGLVKVVIYKVRFEGYKILCKIYRFWRGLQAIPLWVRKILINTETNNWLIMLPNHPTRCCNYLWQYNWQTWIYWCIKGFEWGFTIRLLVPIWIYWCWGQ